MITTTAAGCGFVNISWNATDNNNECSVAKYSIIISCETMDDHVTKLTVTTMNSFTFTGLLDDTLINITVTAVSESRVGLSSDSASVKTKVFKSMLH